MPVTSTLIIALRMFDGVVAAVSLAQSMRERWREWGSQDERADGAHAQRDPNENTADATAATRQRPPTPTFQTAVAIETPTASLHPSALDEFDCIGCRRRLCVADPSQPAFCSYCETVNEAIDGTVDSSRDCGERTAAVMTADEAYRFGRQLRAHDCDDGADTDPSTRACLARGCVHAALRERLRDVFSSLGALGGSFISEDGRGIDWDALDSLYDVAAHDRAVGQALVSAIKASLVRPRLQHSPALARAFAALLLASSLQQFAPLRRKLVILLSHARPTYSLIVDMLNSLDRSRFWRVLDALRSTRDSAANDYVATSALGPECPHLVEQSKRSDQWCLVACEVTLVLLSISNRQRLRVPDSSLAFH